jgi:NADH-quinone oxidoreductase subunit M
LIAIAILIGNVLAAAFLLRAFQQIFIATPKRVHQPYSSTHHPVRKERIITVVICSLLIVTGFYSTPWLDYIDQGATGIDAHYPMHGTQIPLNPPHSTGSGQAFAKGEAEQLCNTDLGSPLCNRGARGDSNAGAKDKPDE